MVTAKQENLAKQHHTPALEPDFRDNTKRGCVQGQVTSYIFGNN